MKNKIKKLKLPLSKMTGDEKNYTAVLLEDVNSNMKAFGEVLFSAQNDVKILKEQVGTMAERLDSMDSRFDSINSRLDSMDSRFDSIDSRLDSMDSRFDSIDSRLDSMDIKLDDMTKEILSIKTELKSLKTSISAKADKEKFETLELRIIRIEKHLELSTG